MQLEELCAGQPPNARAQPADNALTKNRFVFECRLWVHGLKGSWRAHLVRIAPGPGPPRPGPDRALRRAKKQTTEDRRRMTSVLGRPSSVLCASRRLQRDQQILDNIVRMLQAAGESHQPVADTECRARGRCETLMGRGCRMGDQSRRSRRRGASHCEGHGHCHLPRLKISTEALRHAAYSRSLDNGIPVSQTRSCRL